MALQYLVNLITIKKVGYCSIKDFINKSSNYKKNLKLQVWINIFAKNKKF